MVITSLRQSECLDLLGRSRLGRLACAHEGQPYVVPIYFALDGIFIYSFSTVGQKIEWMRSNPLVCVEVDDIAGPNHWMCVIVLGQFQELPETPEWLEERQKAWLRLQEHADWWTPGYSKTVAAGQERPMVPVFFRIRCDTVTGHRVGETETALRPTKDPISRFLGSFRSRRQRRPYPNRRRRTGD